MQAARGEVDLYFNPHIEKILIKLEYNESTVYTVEQSCMNVWYPLDHKIDNLEEANNRFKINEFEFVEVILDDAHAALPVDLHQDTIDTINSTLPKL